LADPVVAASGASYSTPLLGGAYNQCRGSRGEALAQERYREEASEPELTLEAALGPNDKESRDRRVVVRFS